MELVITLWLSSVGLGLFGIPSALLLPAGVVATDPTRIINPASGASSQNYRVDLKMASYGVLNMGQIRVIYNPAGDKAAQLGLQVGQLNTTANIVCPGRGVLLQLDAQAGDYAAQLNRLGGSSDTLAARVEYQCGGAK